MKRINYILIAVFLLFACNLAYSQDSKDLKSNLENLIQMSKAKKFEDAGKFIAYCVDEKKNEYRAPVLTDKEQLNSVKRTAKRIAALAEVSSSFTLGEIKREKVNGIDFQTIPVDFISGSQKITSLFRFVNINGAFLLAEIE